MFSMNNFSCLLQECEKNINAKRGGQSCPPPIFNSVLITNRLYFYELFHFLKNQLYLEKGRI